MATKRDKRIKEIEEVKSKLPDDNYLIIIDFGRNNNFQTDVYSRANYVIKSVFGDLRDFSSLEPKYVFASLITDRSLAKHFKVSISSLIHKNFK